MKILELTHYSAGGCGVWNRVKEESQLLSKKGHDILILTSNHIKGTNEIASPEDSLGKIKIKRFPAKKLGGESYMVWNFEKEAKKFKPDIIIAHSYRHPHTIIASRIAKKLGSKAFLVTHAPFERNSTRSFLAKWYIKIFNDPLVGKPSLKKFDKIIAITNWEIPYLIKLGVKKENIAYIPNGIPKEFFKKSIKKEKNVILFMGRIAPIKNLEILLTAFSLLKKHGYKLKIIGPAEKDYLTKLKNLINRLKIKDNVEIQDRFYNKEEEIKEMDLAKIYVLPSKSEAMPQTLIEAMAKGKIVISSDNLGSKDLIQNGENGFLFESGNPKDLTKKINFALERYNSKKMKNIQKEAKKSVENFSWKNVIKKLENLFPSP